jgi:hypothetical protein
MRQLLVRLSGVASLLTLTCFSMGGCELECNADDRGSVRETIDEIGDEVEDVVDEAKRDNKP